MSIQLANPQDGLAQPDDDDFKEYGFDPEKTDYNFRELMDQVAKLGDCIITVQADQVDILRQGLITRKARDNIKAKQAGLLPDNLVLAFLIYPTKDKEGKEIPDRMDVRVQLRNKKSVTVFDIRTPSDDF